MTDSEISAAPDPELEPAQAVIAAFGGIRPTAHKVGVAVSTVQGWKERSTIPRSRHAEILVAAQSHDIELDPDLLAASDQTQAPTIDGESSNLDRPPRKAAPAAAGAARDGGGSGAPIGDAPSPDDGERRPPLWLARLAPQLPAAALGAAILAAGFLLAMGTSDLWLGDGTDENAVDPAVVAALQQRIERLEQQLETASADGGLTQAEMESLTQSVIAAVDVTYQARFDETQAVLESITGAFAVTETQLAELSTRVAALAEEGQGGLTAEVGAELTQQREALETLSQSLAGLRGTVETLQTTVARLQSQAGSGGEGSGEAGGVTAEELIAFETTVAAVETQIGELQAWVQELSSLPAQAEDLANRLAGLEESARDFDERLAELGGTIGDLGDQLDDLDSRVASLPATSEPGGAAAALALAATNLKETVASGAPYADALAVLTRLVGSESGFAAALDALRPAAETGIRPLGQLVREFEAMAPELVRAAFRSEEQDWIDSLMNDIGELISIRPVGEVEGEGPSAHVARAEQRLAEDDLAGAVAELEALDGEAGTMVADWLVAAKHRLGSLEAAERVVSLALERLARGN